MRNGKKEFEFAGAIFKEGKQYVSLCLDLDVASQGRTIREAKKMLAEAVTLYLETCLECNSPYLRPAPKEQDPRLGPSEDLLEIFPLRVDFKVEALV